ncbi:hypothetical protein C8A00DRAFT_36671 [Chaetomidium leptoderma]|uniref:F-box domain-containing protein n=1 Tax=Chaetomidium leptoderma TaxID=669021 RepID=A0AAN6VG91_9PEZI|nr:hypothetical protein C8A00DRAFT_36671 [Chaetomidium leptoderma]
MNNSNIEPAAPAVDGPTTTPLVMLTSASLAEPSPFPLLRLPTELRLMVYRPLLVSRHRIHLNCLLSWESDCEHRLVVCTQLLRVSRRISNEALGVLYGENDFVFSGDAHIEHPWPIILDHFSQTNQRRLRMLSIEHMCLLRTLDVDPEYEYGSDWDSILDRGDADLDSEPSSDDDDDDGNDDGDGDDDDDTNRERVIAPQPPPHLQRNLHVWGPILANLTRLTITLTLVCCHDGNKFTRESTIPSVVRAGNHASRAIKKSLRFYDVNVLLLHRE